MSKIIIAMVSLSLFGGLVQLFSIHSFIEGEHSPYQVIA